MSRLWAGKGSVLERLCWAYLGLEVEVGELSGGEDAGVGVRDPVENWDMNEKTRLRPIVRGLFGNAAETGRYLWVVVVVVRTLSASCLLALIPVPAPEIKTIMTAAAAMVGQATG
jgi:hypothetical protein